MKHSDVGARLLIKYLSFLLLTCFMGCGVAVAQQFRPDRVLQLADPQHNGKFYMAYVANERKFSFSQERFFDGQSGFIRLIPLVSQELAE